MISIKFIEKSYAQLEFLQKAKKIVKYTVKQQMAQEPITAAPELAKPVNFVPVIKKCKKVVKVEQTSIEQA